MISGEEMDDMFVDLEWDAAGDRVRKGASDGLPFGWLLFAWPVISPVVLVPVKSVWLLFRCCCRIQRVWKRFRCNAVGASCVRSQIDGSGRFFESHESRDRDCSANIYVAKSDLIRPLFMHTSTSLH